MHRYLALTFLLLAFHGTLLSQNIFPQKVDGCKISSFCLDCGNPKATYEPADFNRLMDQIAHSFNLTDLHGKVVFQVLVDSLGEGCVVSHTDGSGNPIVKALISGLDSCRWIPASDAGKREAASINVVVSIGNGNISGEVQRVDVNSLQMTTQGEADDPIIFNKRYRYTNPSLANYTIEVWHQKQYPLPGDKSQHSVMDKAGNLWYATLNGLVKYDGIGFVRFDKRNSPFPADVDVRAMAVDKFDNKWFFTDDGKLYKLGDDRKWETFDSTIGYSSYVMAISAEPDGGVLLGTDRGILRYKAGKWTRVAENALKVLSTRDIYDVYEDHSGRLWIGSFNGSLMIDAENKLSNFNKADAFLKGARLSNATEDGEGNLYFSLYKHDMNDTSRDQPTEGLAIFTKEGKWLFYNDKNSGLPGNSINSLLYDRTEKILWLGVNDVGMVRYDLKGNWEEYDDRNSQVPATIIYDLSEAPNGDIYASTYNGMMRIHKK